VGEGEGAEEGVDVGLSVGVIVCKLFSLGREHVVWVIGEVLCANAHKCVMTVYVSRHPRWTKQDEISIGEDVYSHASAGL
jgi:hypothetical protein